VTGRDLEILLVEDNPADVRLVKEAFKEVGASVALHSVGSGDAALAWLRREAGTARRPDLVLLDLNLPGMSGREVLSALKHDTGLGSIPVVVLTSSAAPTDVLDCYERGANCYVVKPVDFAGMRRQLSGLRDFWRDVAVLPPREAP